MRHGLFRNFHDPYEREWRGGNSRWDLLDVMRLAHALRPEGLAWPLREDGAASFKLEHLATANGVREGDAHEALSDVRALIGIARKLRDRAAETLGLRAAPARQALRRSAARCRGDDAGAARLAALSGVAHVRSRRGCRWPAIRVSTAA